MGFFSSIWSGIKSVGQAITSGAGKVTGFLTKAAGKVGSVFDAVKDVAGKITDIPVVGDVVKTLVENNPYGQAAIGMFNQADNIQKQVGGMINTADQIVRTADDAVNGRGNLKDNVDSIITTSSTLPNSYNGLRKGMNDLNDSRQAFNNVRRAPNILSKGRTLKDIMDTLSKDKDQSWRNRAVPA